MSNIKSPRVGISACFAITILLFFTSFCDLKIEDQKSVFGGDNSSEPILKTVTGFNFITGTSLSPAHPMGGIMPNVFGTDEGQNESAQKISPDIRAILALAAAVLGMVVSFNKRGSKALPGTLLAFGGGIALFLLQSAVKKYETSSSGSFLNIQTRMVFQPGYWLCLAGFAITAIISLWPSPSKPGVPVAASMATPIHVNIITQPTESARK
jgi:hypothetical protein